MKVIQICERNQMWETSRKLKKLNIRSLKALLHHGEKRAKLVGSKHTIVNGLLWFIYMCKVQTR